MEKSEGVKGQSDQGLPPFEALREKFRSIFDLTDQIFGIKFENVQKIE